MYKSKSCIGLFVDTEQKDTPRRVFTDWNINMPAKHKCALLGMDGNIEMCNSDMLNTVFTYYKIIEKRNYHVIVAVPVCSPNYNHYNPLCKDLTGHNGYGILRLYKQATLTKKILDITENEVSLIIQIAKMQNYICSPIKQCEIETVCDDDPAL